MCFIVYIVHTCIYYSGKFSYYELITELFFIIYLENFSQVFNLDSKYLFSWVRCYGSAKKLNNEWAYMKPKARSNQLTFKVAINKRSLNQNQKILKVSDIKPLTLIK